MGAYQAELESRFQHQVNPDESLINKASPNLAPPVVLGKYRDPSSDPLHPSRGKICGKFGLSIIPNDSIWSCLVLINKYFSDQ